MTNGTLPAIIWMPVPDDYIFPAYDGNTPKWIVLHKTAGMQSAQEVAAYFANRQQNPEKNSSHYIIGQDGAIVQCVSEDDGAGANCCLDQGAPFLPQNINLNLLTISIEHVDPALDNSTPLTPAQQQSSFALIAAICQRHNIPISHGDASGGIIGHFEIDSINRARCPGNYPWSQLWAFLGGEMIPQGWTDDGATLTAPNGVKVVRGFRDFVIANNWDPMNYPLEPEHAQQPLELSNPALGNGTQQVFRWSVLEWTPARGVFLAWGGAELLALRAAIAAQPANPDQQKIAAAQSTLHAIIAGATAVLSDLGVS